MSGIQPITLVSVYGVLDGSALASMHQVVADLLPLFDSHDGARVILGGDLNVTTSSKDATYLARAEALLAAVRALGLVEAKTLVAEPPAAPGRVRLRRRGRLRAPRHVGRLQRARPPLRLAGARGPGQRTRGLSLRGRGRAVGPRPARPRPRPLSRADADALGRGVVRRRDRVAPRTCRPPRRRGARLVGRAEGTRARHGDWRHRRRCSPASRRTGSPPSPS